MIGQPEVEGRALALHLGVRRSGIEGDVLPCQAHVEAQLREEGDVHADPELSALSVESLDRKVQVVGPHAAEDGGFDVAPGELKVQLGIDGPALEISGAG